MKFNMLDFTGFLGGIKEALIVTPLMDFVRQKRAAKIGSQVSFLVFAETSLNGIFVIFFTDKMYLLRISSFNWVVLCCCDLFLGYRWMSLAKFQNCKSSLQYYFLFACE